MSAEGGGEREIPRRGDLDFESFANTGQHE